jgi:hypothetical protein
MSPFDVWLVLVLAGFAVGFMASIRSTCLDMVVGTKGTICRRKYRWVEWGDVAPKTAIAMVMLGGADMIYWGIRELASARGVPIMPPEGTIEYALAWGGVFTVATAILILIIYLPLWSLRD